MYCVGATVPWQHGYAWGAFCALHQETANFSWLSRVWSTAKRHIPLLSGLTKVVDGQEHAIQIFVAPDTLYNTLDENSGVLSKAERTLAARHGRAADARRYRASRVLLRTALSNSHSGTAPREWEFNTASNGKPYVVGTENAHFNISHTNAGIILALSHAPIGVDVEELSQEMDESLYKTMLAPGEYHRLMRRRACHRSRYFLKIWSMKEAYAKLLGFGHSLDFAKIEVCVRKGRIVNDSNLGPEVSQALKTSIRFRSFAWRFRQAKHWITTAFYSDDRTRIRTTFL